MRSSKHAPSPTKPPRFASLAAPAPKYPPGLGLPSSLASRTNTARKVPYSTLSALAPEFVPRSASGSSGSSTSSESRQLSSKNHPPAQPTRYIQEEQKNARRPLSRPARLQTSPLFYELSVPGQRGLWTPFPEFINPLLSYLGKPTPLMVWDLTKPALSASIPDDVSRTELAFLPAFYPNLPQTKLYIGDAPAYEVIIDVPHTVHPLVGPNVCSVAHFVSAIETLLREPLQWDYWSGMSIYSKIDLVYAMAARIGISLPFFVADFREKELVGQVDYRAPDAFQMEALEKLVDELARDLRTGKMRVLGKDYLGERTVFKGIEWDDKLKAFRVHIGDPTIKWDHIPRAWSEE